MGHFNAVVFQAIHQLAGRSVFLDDVAVFFAQYLPYLLVAAFLVLVYYQKGMRRKCYVFCEGALAVILARGIIAEILKFFVHEPRPFSVYNFAPLIAESGWAFPSGHMVWFFALSVTVWYVSRDWGVWFFLLSAIMGVARIYVGVHWPLDIIAGVIIGLASGYFVHWLLRAPRRALRKDLQPSAAA